MDADEEDDDDVDEDEDGEEMEDDEPYPEPRTLPLTQRHEMKPSRAEQFAGDSQQKIPNEAT